MISFSLRVFLALFFFISAVTVRADLPVVYDAAIGDSNPANQSGWTASDLLQNCALNRGHHT